MWLDRNVLYRTEEITGRMYIMNKTKKLMEEAILFSIEAISNDIQEKYMDDDDLVKKANSIKTLAEAYDIVHRGKKGDF